MADEYSIFKQRMGALSGAIFLFGLAGLFLVNGLWPGVLLLAWIAAIPALIAEKGTRYGAWLIVQAGLWLIGIPALLALDLIFPGVLILAGTSALLVAIWPPDKLDAQHQAWQQAYYAQQKAKHKRKRGLPLPAVEPKLAEALEYDLDESDEDDDYFEGEIDDPTQQARSQQSRS